MKARYRFHIERVMVELGQNLYIVMQSNKTSMKQIKIILALILITNISCGPSDISDACECKDLLFNYEHNEKWGADGKTPGRQAGIDVNAAARCKKKYETSYKASFKCADYNKSKRTKINAQRNAEEIKKRTKGRTMEEIANDKKNSEKKNEKYKEAEILREKLIPLVQKWTEENNFIHIETEVNSNNFIDEDAPITVITLFKPPVEISDRFLRVKVLYKMNGENVEIDSIVPRFGGVVRERYLEYIRGKNN